MSDIKTKDIKPKSVKTLDKAVAWTERVKDPVVYANEKTKDVTTGQENVVDYGEDRIKYTSNRIKDETIYGFKKASNYTKNKTVNNVKKKYQKKKIIKSKVNNIKGKTRKTKKTIKTANKTVKNTEKAIKETVKISKRMLEQGRKLAISGVKLTIKGVKAVTKVVISSIKAIIAAVKSLIGMLAAGGVVAVIAIVIICLVGLLVTSVYGIFFSSEDIGNNIKMSDCIIELNAEMDNKIKDIEKSIPHEGIKIESNKAEWTDILAIYSVKVSNGKNKQEVMTIDEKKKLILKEIFWDMNNVSYVVIKEKYENDNILDTLIETKDFDDSDKQVLHININSKTIDEMKIKYNFNKEQINQLEEITNTKYLSMWNYAIYGNYTSRGDFSNWKQKGESWSQIKIGTTDKTIGDIGCLVTSISMLIKKSGVPTKTITPFNPGTFVQALNNIYAFDGNGSLQYSPISKLIPNFKYMGRVNLNDKTQIEKLNEIKQYYDKGYYIAVKVVDTNNSQHWVALDHINNNKILMYDPGSNSSNMWDKYNWNNTTQFIYFKAEK